MITTAPVAISQANAMQADNPERGAARRWSLRTFLVPSLIVAVSLGVRAAAFMHWGMGAIESEGAEYARIAENLRHGLGYVGIVTPGPELMFPPLFPWLIAGFSFLTRDYVWAGRLVSLVFGALLPLPAFGIASRLFNRRVGLIAAALFMLHPLFIGLSYTVLTEGPYATLLLSAVYLVLRALDRPTLRMWSSVGAAFGVAYLLRPEAVAPLMIAVFLALVATEGGLFIRGRRAAVAILAFLVLASPEVIFLYNKTDHLRLEGKSAVTSPLAVLILDKEAGRGPGGTPALDYTEAVKWGSAAIDSDMRRIGIWLRPEVDVARDRISTRDLARIVRAAIRQNTPSFLQALSSRWLGAPFLPALALLGAFRRPWRRSMAAKHFYFAIVPATAILASFAVLWIFTRYYFAIVPFLLIYAANGLEAIASWTKASLSASQVTVSSDLVAWLIPSVLGLIILVYPATAIRSLYEFKEGSPANRVVRDAGLWIKQQQKRPVTIMDRAAPLAFHAGAQFVYFPYCSGDLALRFLDDAKVDYVVLRREENFTPYYDEWLAKGIPDPRAQPVYVSSGKNPGDIVVFRWHRADSRLPEQSTAY
jgi:4-amino-4-deoxy-L-arabinose transferase-like glycosyltransferase